MVKDRLAEFQSRARDSFEEVELGNVGASRFDDRLDHALILVDDLSKDVDKLRSKQSQVLALSVVEPRHKDELEGVISMIREKTRQLRPRVQELEDEIVAMMRNNISETQMRIKRNQVDLLRRKMQQVISSFNDSQVEYKERISKRVRRGLQLAGEDITEEQVDRMLQSHSSQVFYREVNPLSVAGRLVLEDATARHEELLELERSLALLQEMFQDMHDLVHVQGDMVNHIETNVQNAVEYVDSGAKQTKQAVEYRNSATRKKIACILIAIIILLILVVIAIVLGVVLSGRKWRSPDTETSTTTQ